MCTIAVIAAMSLTSTDQVPFGLYVAGDHYFWFTKQAFFTVHAEKAVRASVPTGGGPDGALTGKWEGSRNVMTMARRGPLERDRNDPNRGGTFSITQQGNNWFVDLANTTGSEKFGGKLVRIGGEDKDPDLMGGTWKGGQLSLSIVVEKGSLSGSATYAGTDYSISGTRLGPIAAVDLLVPRGGKVAFQFGLAWYPTRQELAQMKFDGKLCGTRLALYSRQTRGGDYFTMTEMKRSE